MSRKHVEMKDGWAVLLFSSIDRHPFLAFNGSHGGGYYRKAFYDTRREARAFLRELRQHKLHGRVARVRLSMKEL